MICVYYIILYNIIYYYKTYKNNLFKYIYKKIVLKLLPSSQEMHNNFAAASNSDKQLFNNNVQNLIQNDKEFRDLMTQNFDGIYLFIQYNIILYLFILYHK